MNRIDRLFGILLLLQTQRKLRAEDIAARYEITQRTVYRDMAALMQLGVPIVAQAGEGYSILDGYFLPPLVFTPDEAKAVFLGIKMLEASGNFQKEAADTIAKLQTAIPAQLHKQIAPLVQAIEFYSEKRRFDLYNPMLLTLQRAIQEKRVLHLSYLGWDETVALERQIEALRLMYNEGTWYLNAYCRLRQDMRSFRLERIQDLKLLQEKFSRDYQPPATEVPNLQVSIRFPSRSLQRVLERQHYGFVSELKEADASIFHYQIHSLSEIRAWVLGWGADVEVIAPEELRQEIRKEAEKWLLRY
jgi:predicted DNA-binding transcriptional regulator YafY